MNTTKSTKKLNALAAAFLETYALLNAPTVDSRNAEWCGALEIDVDYLLQVLDAPDQGYPEKKLPLQTRLVLTNGAGLKGIFQQHQSHALGLNDGFNEPGDGAAIYRMLDQALPALWALKQAARNAASGYQTRASERAQRRDNGAQPQHIFFLKGFARILRSAFGYRVPARKPSGDGLFIKAAMFVSGRIVAQVKAKPKIKDQGIVETYQEIVETGPVTDQGTDLAAVLRLETLTPGAAANLWARARAQKKRAAIP